MTNSATGCVKTAPAQMVTETVNATNLLNKSSIPLELNAEVSLKIAPIELANSLASLSFTCSLSNKSDLFAAMEKTNLLKNYKK